MKIQKNEPVYPTKYMPIYLNRDIITPSPSQLELYNDSATKSSQTNLKQPLGYSEDLYLKTSETLNNYVKHNQMGLKLLGDKVFRQFSIDEFLEKRGMSIEKFMMQLKVNEVKYLNPVARSFLDKNIILTPIPYKNKQLIRSNKEAHEFSAAERGAVSMRTYEYTRGLRSQGKYNEIKSHALTIVSHAAEIIQSWWKYKILPKYSEERKDNLFNSKLNQFNKELKRKKMANFLKEFRYILNKRILLNKKDSLDRLNSTITNHKKLEDCIKMCSVDARDRFDLVSDNDKSRCFFLQTVDTFSLSYNTTNKRKRNCDTFNIGSEQSFSYDQVNKYELVKSFQEKISKLNAELNKIGQPIIHCYIPNQTQSQFNFGSNGNSINTDGYNQKQKPFKIEHINHQSFPSKIGRLPSENVIEKSFMSFEFFPDPLNISHSNCELRLISKQYDSVSFITKKNYSLHDIIYLQESIRKFMLRRNKSKQIRATLVGIILNKTSKENENNNSILLSSLYRLRMNNSYIASQMKVDNLSYGLFAISMNCLISNKKKQLMNDSFRMLKNIGNQKVQSNQLSNSKSIPLLKISNKINHNIALKRNFRNYFKIWKLMSFQKKGQIHCFQKESFSHLFESISGNQKLSNENDLRSLKILMLTQKITKCILKRKHSFLKFLSRLSENEEKKLCAEYSKTRTSFKILSFAKLLRGMNKLTEMLRYKHMNDFYHRLVLSYLISKNLTLNNDSLISILKYGKETTYHRTLNRILSHNLTYNIYIAQKNKNLFVDYVKELISDKEGKQNTLVKVSPAKKRESIPEIIDEDKPFDYFISQSKNFSQKNPHDPIISSPQVQPFSISDNKKKNSTNLMPPAVRQAYSLLHSGFKKTPNKILLREIRDEKDIV